MKVILGKTGMEKKPIDIIPCEMASATRRLDMARTIVSLGSPPHTLFVSRVLHR